MKKFLVILLFLASHVNGQQMFYALNQPASSAPSSNAFITTWNIPSNSYTLDLVFSTGLSGYNFTLYWGDGSSDFVTNGGTQSHTYATLGTYTIAIDGTCPNINFLSQSALYSIIQWGNIGCSQFTCESSGLTTITAPTSSVFFNGCTSLQSAFKSCLNLTSITPGVLNSAINVTNLTNLYNGCTNIVGAIPEGFLDYCMAVTTLSGAWQSTKIDSLPPGLLDNLTALTNLQAAFTNTWIRIIPTGFLDQNTALTTLFATFQNTKLTAVSSGLLTNNTSVTNLNQTFQSCSLITSDVPELWVSHSSASHSATFRNCTSAANYSDIPSDWK